MEIVQTSQEERDPIIDIDTYRMVVESELEALRKQNFKYRLMITQLKTDKKDAEAALSAAQNMLRNMKIEENGAVPLTRPLTGSI